MHQAGRRMRLLVAGALAASACASPASAPADFPLLSDDRLELTLLAADPEIVTPIGIAVDPANRVFVLESHTHLTPPDYAGPKHDRVKLLIDRDGEGRPDSVSVFADGLEDGLNLAFSPDGELFVVTSRAVWALHDRDGDSVSEARTRILAMTRPQRVYDHAALLGLTFSADGWLYVSRGNTGGAAWRVEGSDGSSLGGYGDGGSIMRCRPDGSRLQEVATGFWNPFDLKFDTFGRLLAADNDPDSRGPNRLVHVIQGGDYGYKSLYGESGIHPYQAWNGELPGTLPYAAALGEAPSGLFVAAHGALPPDYRHDVLVTIWEERKIARVRLEPDGVSVSGTVDELVRGADRFRPVAFAADARGSIYVTDWMVREYPNHGKGRIWRLRARRGVDTVPPRRPLAPLNTDSDGEPLRRLYEADSAADFDRLRDALASGDSFLTTAAIARLGLPVFRAQVIAATAHEDPRVRSGALLALERARYPDLGRLGRRLLSDPDEDVRRVALLWAGRSGDAALRPVVDRALVAGPVSPDLFELYLATVEQLAPAFIDAYRGETAPYARSLKRRLPAGFVEAFVTDRSRPEALRVIALRSLPDPAASSGTLVRLARDARFHVLQLEAVRSLALHPAQDAGKALVALLRDATTPPVLRAEVLVALARQPVDASADAVALLDDANPEVRLEAARYLRSVEIEDSVEAVVQKQMRSLDGLRDANIRAQLAFAVEAGGGPRPATPEEWARAVGDGGNAATGRRVFFSVPAACAQCHVFEGRGGDLGPALTHVGRSKSRGQLLDAILRPSAEISPEYQGWYVKASDGTVHTGRQIDLGDGGRSALYVLPGRFATFEKIQGYGTLPGSLMPEGLDSNLSVEDIRDLLAFLAGTPAAPTERAHVR